MPGSEDDDASPFEGDQVLANTGLRMRDSLHYEFRCAISDGDIGRAMNVMAVSHSLDLVYYLNTHTI